MIQRIIVFIFIYLLIAFIPQNSCCGSFAASTRAYAEDTLKINSINFDNSDSIIFLGTSSATTDEDTFTITKKVLTNPDRVFFDIENAVITFPNSTYELKNSRLTQVRIAQNTTNPNVVRIVIWNSKNYDSSQIKVLKIKNNIIIKLSNEIPLQQYLSQIYKETKESSVEYYDKAVIIPEEKPISESDEIFNKVQQAFKAEDKELVRPNIEQKQAKLKSRFFLEKALPKNGNILISGIGVINIEKPFKLTEPSRIVFDLPNTIVLQELREKEIKITETDTIKIGQFAPSKARIVIKTNTPELYIPIYSTNLQTLLIANRNNLSGVNLADTLSELAYFKEQKINSSTDVINIIFSNPVIYSIEKTAGKINVTFYNLSNFNTDSFNTIAKTNGTGFEAKKISSNIYSMSFPVDENTLTDCYETLNASQLRFIFTHKQVEIQPKTEVNKLPEIKLPVQEPVKPQIKKDSPFADLLSRQKTTVNKTNNRKIFKKKNSVITKIKNKVIIIDPGHGGNDTGAMRGRILEKDLTLQIALKVKNILKEQGLNKVYMTRSTDSTLSLAQRVEFANSNNADIYVSIHINASVKSEINGIETHYYSEKGYDVAKVMHKELMEKVSASDRGLFKSKFYVINHTEAPAVLLELGFISNEAERNALISEKRQMDSAEAIAEGIINYLTEH